MAPATPVASGRARKSPAGLPKNGVRLPQRSPDSSAIRQRGIFLTGLRAGTLTFAGVCRVGGTDDGCSLRAEPAFRPLRSRNCGLVWIAPRHHMNNRMTDLNPNFWGIRCLVID